MRSFTHTKRGDGENLSNHMKGGTQKVLRVFFMQKMEVFARFDGERKKFPLFKRGCTQSFTLS